MALLVAACFAIGWAARLGWIADYLSRPVLVGYIHGVAAVLVISQLGKLLGVEVDAANPLRELVETLGALPSASLATIAVGVGALLVLLPLRFLAPRVPAALLLVVAGIVPPRRWPWRVTASPSSARFRPACRRSGFRRSPPAASRSWRRPRSGSS